MIGVLYSEPAVQSSSGPLSPGRSGDVAERQGPQEMRGQTQAFPTPGLSISVGSLSNGGKSDPCLGTAWKTRGQRMPKNEARCRLPLEPGEGNGNVFLEDIKGQR